MGKELNDEYRIYVNAQEKIWKQSEIAYKDLVDLAFPPPHRSTEMFTIQYSKGTKENPQGVLSEDKQIQVKDKMVFDVTRTDKS